MLKIKGLKKKKKGKKGKHKEEDDLFDPQELEKYRREHQQNQEVGVSSDTATGDGASSSEQSEEWKKFQALTAGVDDILKKTQGDLSRIKETSYFKRKPPGPSQAPGQEGRIFDTRTKKWIRADGSAVEEEAQEEEKNKEVGEENTKAVEEQPPPPEEEEEEEEESEQDEDIFDTSYVDVVASGDVKLAYIPDSPTEEELGPDPFDTSIVDKVIKVDPKKRNLVSLGCAVEVLTGKVDKAIPVTESLPAKRKRPKKQDLLLGSFDEVDASLNEANIVIDEPVAKSILDEGPECVLDDEIDLSINLATQLPPPSPIVERRDTTVTENKDNTFSKSVVEEFDAVNQSNQVQIPDIDEELDDEFAALAQESILKEGTKDPSVNFDLEDGDDGVDPFDTEFAANILPGKYELKLIEEEILLKEHDFPEKAVPKFLEDIPSVRLNDAVNEHNFLDDDQTPLSFKHRDLLGGSTTDLSKIGDSPIEPAALKDSEEITYSDPFDTSVVDVLTAPGKTELRFLEKELLDGVVQIDDSDDFNPREDCIPKPSKPPVRPDQLPVGGKRLSIPKVVAFNIDTLEPESDLLTVDQEDSAKISKPLTPYYANTDVVNSKSSCESENHLSDPFDTSFVTHAPGKAELKLIESELSSAIDRPIKRNLSDPDFDPRQGDDQSLDKTNTIQVNTLPAQLNLNSPEKLQPDILSGDSEITIKLHTPVVPKKIEEELDKIGYSDPFDTSIVNDILPGKAELKLLESELISSDIETTLKRSYTDPDFNPRDSIGQEKPLKTEEVSDILDNTDDHTTSENPLCPEPIFKGSSGLVADYSTHLYEDTALGGPDIDPFDTSCVDSLVPGKTELKLLESELLN